jgi:hypothetical protein
MFPPFASFVAKEQRRCHGPREDVRAERQGREDEGEDTADESHDAESMRAAYFRSLDASSNS